MAHILPSHMQWWEIRMVEEVSDQNFQQVVLDSEIPVLVDFWAPWIALNPCFWIRHINYTVKEPKKKYEHK